MHLFRVKCSTIPVDIVAEAATSEAVVGDADNGDGDDVAGNDDDGGKGGIVDIDDGECIVADEDGNPFTGCPFICLLLLCPLLLEYKINDIQNRRSTMNASFGHIHTTYLLWLL